MQNLFWHCRAIVFKAKPKVPNICHTHNTVSSIAKFFKDFVDGYIAPCRCPVCRRITAPHEAICPRCAITMPFCSESGHELLANRAALVNAPFRTGMVRAWFRYDPDDAYAALIRDTKYHDRPQLAVMLGTLFGKYLMSLAPEANGFHVSDIDVLLPMPMHISKKLRRGYNQSEEIARGIADAIGAAVGDNLVAVRNHGTQTRLSDSRRAENIRGCFALCRGDELDGLNVAVVDDIITTGSSMNEAVLATALGGTHPASISLLALGATVKIR